MKLSFKKLNYFNKGHYFHNGAKPTLSSAFRIADINQEKDILNIILEDISVYINFDSHLGLAISKVKKEYIKDYKKIDIKFIEE